jgi:hypothetical protein
MSDKLQDVVERFIAENENAYEARDKYGDLHGANIAIDVADLRAFLAQYVLCEREPKMYYNPTNGDVLPSGVVRGASRIRYVGYEVPLHAPAKGVE